MPARPRPELLGGPPGAGTLFRSAAQLGLRSPVWASTPKEALEEFYKQDPEGNLDRIFAKLIPQAPAIKQAEAKLLQARRDLDRPS